MPAATSSLPTIAGFCNRCDRSYFKNRYKCCKERRIKSRPKLHCCKTTDYCRDHLRRHLEQYQTCPACKGVVVRKPSEKAGRQSAPAQGKQPTTLPNTSPAAVKVAPPELTSSRTADPRTPPSTQPAVRRATPTPTPQSPPPAIRAASPPAFHAASQPVIAPPSAQADSRSRSSSPPLGENDDLFGEDPSVVAPKLPSWLALPGPRKLPTADLDDEWGADLGALNADL